MTRKKQGDAQSEEKRSAAERLDALRRRIDRSGGRLEDAGVSVRDLVLLTLEAIRENERAESAAGDAGEDEAPDPDAG